MNFLDRAALTLLPLVPRWIMARFSSRYIAGEGREDALEVAARLQGAGYRLTFDNLGEAVGNREGVAAAAQEYRRLIAALGRRDLEGNVSVKPTQMGLLLGEDLCFETVSGLVSELRRADGFLRFEMEDSPTTQATLKVFRRLRAAYGSSVGCVLQARLRRSEEDARALVAQRDSLNVRLVKGVYREPADIAFQGREEIRASFLRILEILLDGGAFVGVATHDEKLVEGLEALLAGNAVFRERFEIQMLLGVREPLRQQIRARGMPVRVYLPYGRDWHAYVVRRLKENPELARQALRGMILPRERLQDQPGGGPSSSTRIVHEPSGSSDAS
ncbi:MAG: proline dehydrogenase family protein [Planctomycetota bacterium]